MDAIGVSDRNTSEKCKKPRPVTKCDPQPQNCENATCIRGMSNIAVRSGFDHVLPRNSRNVKGEVSAEDPHGVVAKCDAAPHEDDSNEKNPHAVPQNVGLRKTEAK